MKTSSAKAKGRRLQDKVVLKLRNLFENILEKDDIKPAIMGTSGVDTVLSPSAKNLIAFDIECKNVETFISAQMREALIQSKSNTEHGRVSLLIFKGNNEPERVILELDDFFSLIYPNNNVSFSMDERQKIVVELEKLKQLILKERKEHQIDI